MVGPDKRAIPGHCIAVLSLLALNGREYMYIHTPQLIIKHLDMNVQPLHLHLNTYTTHSTLDMITQIHAIGFNQLNHNHQPTQVTTSPAAIYYEYNSYYQRYALYEMRHGQNGLERIYLVPVLLPDEGQHNRKVVKGIGIEAGASVPESYYTFMAFKADITIYVPDLPAF